MSLLNICERIQAIKAERGYSPKILTLKIWGPIQTDCLEQLS